MDNPLAHGEYTYTLSGFPASFCDGRTQKNKNLKPNIKNSAGKMTHWHSLMLLTR